MDMEYNKPHTERTLSFNCRLNTDLRNQGWAMLITQVSSLLRALDIGQIPKRCTFLPVQKPDIIDTSQQISCTPILFIAPHIMKIRQSKGYKI